MAGEACACDCAYACVWDWGESAANRYTLRRIRNERRDFAALTIAAFASTAAIFLTFGLLPAHFENIFNFNSTVSSHSLSKADVGQTRF